MYAHVTFHVWYLHFIYGKALSHTDITSQLYVHK
jgi:hypothetical protein